MSRDKTFRSYGDGIYGLFKQSHELFKTIDATPELSNGADDFELTELLLDILSDIDTPLVDRKGENSPKAALDELETGNTSKDIAIVRGKSLEEQILKAVRDHAERLTGREIARILGRNKTEINRCLYLELRGRGRLAYDDERRWYIPNGQVGALQNSSEAA